MPADKYILHKVTEGLHHRHKFASDSALSGYDLLMQKTPDDAAELRMHIIRNAGASIGRAAAAHGAVSIDTRPEHGGSMPSELIRVEAWVFSEDALAAVVNKAYDLGRSSVAAPKPAPTHLKDQLEAIRLIASAAVGKPA